MTIGDKLIYIASLIPDEEVDPIHIDLIQEAILTIADVLRGCTDIIEADRKLDCIINRLKIGGIDEIKQTDAISDIVASNA